MLHLITVDISTYTLLEELFSIDFISKKFALAGGTSLALQIGHRKSIDLDIFATGKFDIKELQVLLAERESFNYQYIGNNTRMLFAAINNVKCDFVTEPAKLIEPFIYFENVKYYSIADIAAMKLHAVCGRGKKKDFFDVYALLELYSWKELLKWFLAKYDIHQLFFLKRSIIYFEDAENDPDLISFSPYNASWEEIKSILLEKCS